MLTYKLISFANRNAICSGTRKVVVAVGQALFSFSMPLWFCAVILLSVPLPVYGTSAFTGSEGKTDTLQNNSGISVFRETLLFPKASSVVLRDFEGNGAVIDSICRFFSDTANRNLIDIKVTGSYSPEGKYWFNIDLAEARARALARLVRKINQTVNPELSVRHNVVGQADDYRRLRSAELQIVYRNIVSDFNELLPDASPRQKDLGSNEGNDNAVAKTHEADTTCSITTPPPMT